MYEFVDTIETASASNSRLAEAFKINGNYLEEKVPGYKTLYANGRESLAAELNIYGVGVRDGERIKSRRFPAREIIIGFQIVAPNSTEFRNSFNLLNYWLDEVNAQIIFDDEPDKYFKGSPVLDLEVEPGKNSITGEYYIFCADPFKYSVTEYYVDMEWKQTTDDDGGTVTLPVFDANYSGTYRSYPRFEVQFGSNANPDEAGFNADGDCGYFAMANDKGNVLLFGNESEDDYTSRTVFNKAFTSLWSGTFAKTLNSSFTRQGSMKIGTIGSTKCAMANSHGSTTGSTGYIGPTMGFNITKRDAEGQVGAKDFTLTWKQRFATGTSKDANKEKGAFTVLALDASDRIVAAVAIRKNKNTDRCQVDAYVNGKSVWSKENMPAGHYGRLWGFKDNRKPKPKNGIYVSVSSDMKPVLTSAIIKDRGYFMFDIAGYVFQIYDESLADRRVTKVVFQFCAYKNTPVMKYNALYSAKFVDTNFDMVNKFTADDLLEIDCNSGSVLLNDGSGEKLGALGNDWEDFFLTSGQNIIACSWSNWTQLAPSARMYYRKVYL